MHEMHFNPSVSSVDLPESERMDSSVVCWSVGCSIGTEVTGLTSGQAWTLDRDTLQAIRTGGGTAALGLGQLLYPVLANI